MLAGAPKFLQEHAVGLLLFEYVPRDGDGMLLAEVLGSLIEHEYDVYLVGRRRLLMLTRASEVQVSALLKLTDTHHTHRHAPRARAHNARLFV